MFRKVSNYSIYREIYKTNRGCNYYHFQFKSNISFFLFKFKQIKE